MNEYDLYIKRLYSYGTDITDCFVNSTISKINSSLKNSSSYRKIIVKNKEMDVRFIIDKIFSNGKGYEENKLLLRPNEEIKAGTIVDIDNLKWLVTYFNNNKIYPKSYILKCNHNLKWVDSSNNLIIKPSIVSAQTLYTTGIKDEKVIEIPNGMQGIQFPYDEDTKKLDIEDTFVFNKTKYKITNYDETTYPGLIVLICTEIGTSHLDDKINEIADRWVEINGEKIDRLPWLDEQEPPEEPIIPEEPTGITYTITAQMPYPNDSDNEIWLGDTAIYTIHKFVDSVEVDSKFTFEITDTSVATITNTTDNTVSIKANDFVGSKNIKLIATDTDTKQIAIEKEIIIKGRQVN